MYLLWVKVPDELFIMIDQEAVSFGPILPMS